MTFMVNVWINYKPVCLRYAFCLHVSIRTSSQPLLARCSPFPEEMLKHMSTEKVRGSGAWAVRSCA